LRDISVMQLQVDIAGSKVWLPLVETLSISARLIHQKM